MGKVTNNASIFGLSFLGDDHSSGFREVAFVRAWVSFLRRTMVPNPGGTCGPGTISGINSQGWAPFPFEVCPNAVSGQEPGIPLFDQGFETRMGRGV